MEKTFQIVHHTLTGHLFVMLGFLIYSYCQSEFNPPHERSNIMKRALILISSFLLLFSFNCATSKQEKSKGTFDLSGTWIMTEEVIAPNCGGNKAETYTIEATQKDDTITTVNKDRGDLTDTAKISGDLILFTEIVPEFFKGKVRISAGNVKISGDANTMTGRFFWLWEEGRCGGITNVTYKRK